MQTKLLQNCIQINNSILFANKKSRGIVGHTVGRSYFRCLPLGPKLGFKNYHEYLLEYHKHQTTYIVHSSSKKVLHSVHTNFLQHTLLCTYRLELIMTS